MSKFDCVLRKLSRGTKWFAFLMLFLMVLLTMWCLHAGYPLDQARLVEMFVPLLVTTIAVSCGADFILAMRRKENGDRNERKK